MPGEMPLNPLLNAASLPASPTNALMPKTPDQMEMAAPRNYETKLTAAQMPAYHSYVSRLAQMQGKPVEHVLRDTYDYDLQGAFLANLQPDARGHLPDTFKKPNHPTFSTHSQFNGIDGNQGGVWSQPQGPQGPWSFTAGQTNVDNMGGPAGLQRYFDQYERGNSVVMPPQPPYPGY